MTMHNSSQREAADQTYPLNVQAFLPFVNNNHPTQQQICLQRQQQQQQQQQQQENPRNTRFKMSQSFTNDFLNDDEDVFLICSLFARRKLLFFHDWPPNQIHNNLFFVLFFCLSNHQWFWTPTLIRPKKP